MKIIIFQGGLGNQLFQFCFYKYLEKNNTRIIGYFPNRALNRHNGLEIQKWFDISLPKSRWWASLLIYPIWMCNKILKRLNRPLLFTKDDHNSNDKAFIYDGYWQDKVYQTESTRLEFKKDLIISKENKSILKMLTSSESVSIHVRRGDYTDPKTQHIYGNICTMDYYKEAINEIKKKVSNPRFFFFSDEPEYIKRTFELENSVIVSCNKGDQSFFDMYLMAHAKHMILANSTFSCWAAYLNRDVINVICPDKFINTLPSPPIIKEEWITIKTK